MRRASRTAAARHPHLGEPRGAVAFLFQNRLSLVLQNHYNKLLLYILRCHGKAHLQQISFYSDFGNSFNGNAIISHSGEITTVQEAHAIFAATVLLLGGIAHFITTRQSRSYNAARDRVFIVR